MTHSLRWKNVATGEFRKNTDVSYQMWLKYVNMGVRYITGVPLDSGEDVNSRLWYDDDMTVDSAIEEVLDAWGFSDFEF